MATKKETTTQKAATSKPESRFYIARTIQETRDTLKNKVNTYNEKYVKKQMKTGREFITGLKDDPMKRLDDSIDDTREFIKEFKTDSKEKYDTFIVDGKKTIKRVKKGPFKAVGKIIYTVKTDTRQTIKKVRQTRGNIYKGIEGDARLVMDDMVSMGKRTFNKLPMKKTIEKKINNSIAAIPSKLNLPSKEEIKNLMTGVDGVNKKMDKLNKLHTNA